ncbi:MAG TPA: GNAT family protein [Chloroflexia bacterium]|nr:GNAT family protein [Chloroflexia bacterium]
MSAGEAALRAAEQHIASPTITAMDTEAAAAIATWRYPPPYHFYNLAPDVAPYLLDPRNAYFVARNPAGDLVGFFCYGAEAQVPGGHCAGLYADSTALDMGLGMHPGRTGGGHGAAFLTAGLAFGRQRFAPARFRLSVATFNMRAIRAYMRAGFRPGPVFSSPARGGDLDFLLMVRDSP